jgi:hypothetical protein
MITVIGVYDEFAPAQSAKNEVLAGGVSWRYVQLNPDHEMHQEARSATPHTGDATLKTGIGNLFSSLFGGVGDKSTHSNVYAEAVRRGGYVLTVDVDTDAQRTSVQAIMSRYHPVDMEQRSADWMQHGWRGHDPSAPVGGSKVRTVGGTDPTEGR